MSEKYRVALLTHIPSPFQLEFSQAINETGEIEYQMFYEAPATRNRPSHWVTGTEHFDIGLSYSELQEKLLSFEPTHLIIGGYTNGTFRRLGHFFRRRGSRSIFWLEQPLPRRWPVAGLKALIIRNYLKAVDIILAIGPRAYDFYRRLSPHWTSVIEFPYYQDLSPCFIIPERTWSGEITFLYSGRLIHQHNISGLVTAFSELQQHYRSEDWRLCISAYGDQEPLIRTAIAEGKLPQSRVHFETNFDSWNSRLRPLESSHVLISTSFHSGWGLVIPEAMASGALCLVSRQMESGRYFVRDGINGILIEPDHRSLLNGMLWVLNNRERAAQMARLGREAAKAGHVDAGVQRLRDILEST